MGGDYEAYTRHIAAEMARNGHPRLCAARGVSPRWTLPTTRQCFRRLRTSPLQEFHGSRPGMLSQQPGTGCRWVIALPRPGAEYNPDCVVAQLDSGGLHWTLVELESLRAGLFTRQGRRPRQGEGVPTGWSSP